MWHVKMIENDSLYEEIEEICIGERGTKTWSLTIDPLKYQAWKFEKKNRFIN